MESNLKKTIINALTELIKAIDNGQCDSMTTEQYDRLIECLQILVEVKQEKKRKIWNFGKR